MKKISLVIKFLIIAFISFSACSDNSTDPDIENGHGAFSVTGDVNNSYEGEANFVTSRAGEIYTAVLSITNDRDDDFSLLFTTSSTSSISISTGVYTIGAPESNEDDGIFTVTFTVYTNDEPKTFHTFGDSDGSLTVSRSTNRILEGSFQFNAFGFEEGEVTIEGSFTAVKR